MTLVEPSWDVARSTAAGLGKFLGSERVSIHSALDRILASDAISLVDLPTYETSAMDGYVVAGGKPWKLIGEIKAGEIFAENMNPGEAYLIVTGAVIPRGAFGVLRWEDAKVENGFVSGATSERKDFRPKGAEAREGEVLIDKGTSLKPGMLGLLAASGYDEIEVARKPRVAILLLGDEIQMSGKPENGLVRDSIGPQLPSWLRKLGCELVQVEYVSDDKSRTIEAINSASQAADIVITTSGTADGPRDFLHRAIEELSGSIHVDKVAVRPGHPQLLGEVNGIPLLGLPGNPQSAIVALMTLGAPLIDSILGRKSKPLPIIQCDEILEAQPSFSRLVVGSLNRGWFTPGTYLGSAMLRSLAHGDGFAVCTNPPTTLRWLELPL